MPTFALACGLAAPHCSRRFVHVKKTIKSALNTIIEEHARHLEMWANRKNLQLVGAGVMDLVEKTCHDVYSRRYANATSAKAVA